MPNDQPSSRQTTLESAFEEQKWHDDPRRCFIENLDSVDLNISYAHEDAVVFFNQMPVSKLPVLPFGYQWVKKNSPGDPHTIVKHKDVKKHKFQLVLYGKNANEIDYNFLVDNQNICSYTQTMIPQTSANRRFPFRLDQYRVPGFTYTNQFKCHVRGHCCDHQDTKTFGLEDFYSTYDSRNYIPENRYWGMIMRRVVVQKLRKISGSYMQQVHYPDNPYTTKNNHDVPGSIYFSTFNCKENTPSKIYNIFWDRDYKAEKKQSNTDVISFCDKFTTSLDTYPLASPYSPSATNRMLRTEQSNQRKRCDNKKSYNHLLDSSYAVRQASMIDIYNLKHIIQLAFLESEMGNQKWGIKIKQNLY